MMRFHSMVLTLALGAAATALAQTSAQPSAGSTTGTTGATGTTGSTSSDGAAATAKPEGSTTATTAKASKDVAEFLGKLHDVNQAEIQAGKLAQQKGQAQAVKDYGQTLVSDHEQLDARVSDVAKKLNVDLSPAAADKAVNKEKAKLDKVQTKLDKTEASKFDQTFAKEMVSGHEDALKLVDKAEKNLKDADVKELATAARPVLQHHLDQAKQLKQTAAAH